MAAVAAQGISDSLNDVREGKLAFVGPAAVTVVKGVKLGMAKRVVAEEKHRLRQRQPIPETRDIACNDNLLHIR